MTKAEYLLLNTNFIKRKCGMYALQSFKFLENATQATESNVLAIPNRASQLVIQIDGGGSFDIEVLGSANAESDLYYSLAMMNAKDFNVAPNATQGGIYTVGIDGISRVKVKVNTAPAGGVSVFGKVGE